MSISREEALKSLDDIFNYCEEIDNNIPENERSGYKMLPDIHRIRKYIIDNTRPHGEWIREIVVEEPRKNKRAYARCSACGCRFDHYGIAAKHFDFCPKCGAECKGNGGDEE